MQIAFGLEELIIGSIVWYYDDNRLVLPGIVTAIYPNEEDPTHPRLTLSCFMTTLMSMRAQVPHIKEDSEVQGGYRLIKRWSFPQEVPYSDPDDDFQRFYFHGERHPRDSGWNAAMTHYCSNVR